MKFTLENCHQNTKSRDKEMAQWLRARTALVERTGVLSTHAGVLLERHRDPLLASEGTALKGTHPHRHMDMQSF